MEGQSDLTSERGAHCALAQRRAFVVAVAISRSTLPLLPPEWNLAGPCCCPGDPLCHGGGGCDACHTVCLCLQRLKVLVSLLTTVWAVYLLVVPGYIFRLESGWQIQPQAMVFFFDCVPA